MADFTGEICQDRRRLGRPSRQRRAPRAPWGLPTPNVGSTLGQRSVNVGSTLGIFPSHRGPIFVHFAGFVHIFRDLQDYQNGFLIFAIFQCLCTVFSKFRKFLQIFVEIGRFRSDFDDFFSEFHDFFKNSSKSS